MPGRHLSDREESLAAFWREPPASFGQPLLKGVTLRGPPSLRGIQDIYAPFEYPITAICGRNGSGKSTILGLAAFSACRPSTWSVSPRRVPSVRPPLRTMSFAWDEFFFRRAGDPLPTGLKVQFDYSYRGDDLRVSRRRTEKGRWATAPDPGRSRTPRLPERPIDFVSLARIIPPGELRSPRRRFSGHRPVRIVSLTERSVQAMSSIFEQSYKSVEIQTQRGVPLAHCRSMARYNGFDMGSGENSAVAILGALEQLPPGGLLLVEEIEHGFHPLAQRRLVEVLTEMVSGGKQQIICTTHSEYVIDALPQAARLLVNRVPDGHRVVTAQTTRDLMFTMTGEPRPELTVYVEDYFAQTIVEQALGGAHRRRVKVVPAGSGEKVVELLGTHGRAGLDGPAMCVLDGDCTEAEVDKWMRSAGVDPDAQPCVRLPQNGLCPERWILDALGQEPHVLDLSRQVSLDVGEVRAVLSEMAALSDPHVVPRQFAARCSVPVENATYVLASCVGTHPALQEIRDVVASRLGGESE